MIRVIDLVLLLVLGTLCAGQQYCNATHFDFRSNYSLGQQNELNCTFTKAGQKIDALENVTFKANDSVTYNIFNAKPVLYYIDSKQKAEVIDNDTIVISGGHLEVMITFNWTKKSSAPVNGSGIARALSDQIAISKNITIVDGFYEFQLTDVIPILFSDQINITRYDPPTTSDQDVANLLRLVNNIMGVRTIKIELEDIIDSIYTFILKTCLHDEHQPITAYFEYLWVPTTPGKPNVTIPFTRRGVSIDVERVGMSFKYETRVKDANWTCGKFEVPLLPLSVKLYGGIQQFISLSFYESVIRYAINAKLLDTDLNKDNWESRMFQFYAGDLYEIFPDVATKYYASDIVTGNCKAGELGLTVWQSGIDTFNVSIQYNCELNVGKQKLIDIVLGLELTIVGEPQQSTLNFRLKSFHELPSFFPVSGIKFNNEQLAREMLNHSLRRLHEGRLFGSGWPQSPPKDYPHFMIHNNCTVVYDSTHIERHSATQ